MEGAKYGTQPWGEVDRVEPNAAPTLGHTQGTLRDVYMPTSILDRILGFQVDSKNYSLPQLMEKLHG